MGDDRHHERMIKMAIKNEMIRRLRQDCKILMDVKIPKALENISDEKGVNTYRNLTKALAENIKLIEELESENYILTIGNEDTPFSDINKGVKRNIINHVKARVGDNVVVLPEFAKLTHISSNDEFGNGMYIKGVLKDDTSEKLPLLPKIKMDLSTENTDDDNKYIWFKKLVGSIVNNRDTTSQVTIPVTEATRGVGKTTLLVEEALDNNGVVVTSSRNLCDYIKDFISKDVKVVYKESDLKLIPNSTPLYIEEMVIWDDIIKHIVEKHPYLRFKYYSYEIK